MTAQSGSDGGNESDGRQGPLVLVVEDDPETRHFYVDALNHHGFRTDVAHNGLQALDKALASPPDLVLADIAVPGIGAARHRRGTHSRANRR